MPLTWRRRYGAYIRRGDSVGGSGWRSAGALHPGFLVKSSPRAAIGLEELASPGRRGPVGHPPRVRTAWYPCWLDERVLLLHRGRAGARPSQGCIGSKGALLAVVAL